MFEPVSGDARVLYQNLLGAFARGYVGRRRRQLGRRRR